MVAVKAPTTSEVYKSLCAALKAEPKYQTMVVAHIAAKHAIHTLPAFQTSDAITEAQKLETYGEIVRVIAGKAPASTLQGQVAAGQAKDDSPAPAGAVRIPELPAFKPEDLTKSRTAVIPLPTPSTGTNDREDDEDRIRTVMPPDPAPTPPAGLDPAIDQLREALRKVIGPQDAKLDEDRVKHLIKERLDAHAKDIQHDAENEAKAILAKVDKAIAEALAAIKSTVVTHEFKVDGTVRPVAGAIHRQLPQIVAWMRAEVPVWLWGQAGGGKTHLARQVAEALGLKFYCAPIDETITVGKLVGYRNVSNGEFVEGLMYRAYKEGGVQLLDEIDTNATAIASTNSLSANGHYTFPNGEEVTRHKDFRLLAGANSKGTGAVAGYTARVRMDAATLDRFAVIKLEYDAGLELALTCGVPSTSQPWELGAPADEALCRAYVEWVQKVRAKVGDSVLISPRASYNGVKALRVGIPAAEVAEALVFKLVTEDTRRRILSDVGPVPSSS